MDFGQLSNDADLRTKVTNITDSLTAIDSTIDATIDFANYEDLSTEEKVKYDLYLSFSLNSLYWAYCKVQGIDVNKHDIKNEISRVRTAMVRDQRLLEHRTIRPVLDAKAAGRFIRNGLWEAKQTTSLKAGAEQQKAQKRKFEDDYKER